jgi:type IV pilus assembly protein PilQ
VQDTPSRLVEVRKLIAKIDVPVRQVMIEARIVEADENFNKNLGAKLGYNRVSQNGYQMPLATGQSAPRYAIGSTMGNTYSSAIQAADPSVVPTGAVPNGGLMSNLPAAGLNSFNPGVFSFILFNSALTQFLNMEISALEADGKGKTISSPRVLTADGVEALIEQGQEIPYQQATSSGATSVSFRKATLSLKVKPQITPDGNIIMTLDVNKDEPGAVTPGGVAINTKHVKTEVLVENGGTVVIGGIFEQRDRTDITRVPFFGDLPYIGFLFKNNTTSTSKTELLVFLTPRIVHERLTVR